MLNAIAPGSSLLAVSPLPGSYSNYSHLVEARAADGLFSRFVIRRYAVFGDYDRGEKARREFRTFELLQRHGIPAPRPLLLDDTGDLLGSPGIVTAYVDAEMVQQPAGPLAWARAMARMLARIHAIPCHPARESFLLDADQEASWFLRSAEAPAYIAAHPLGETLWRRVNELWQLREPVPAGLVHVDYWSGNILWQAGRDFAPRIVAVVDWEEAAYGDPGIDVAYCRMDMLLLGYSEAADEFLAVYEAEAGRPVANLALWELAAAVRPMFSPEGWIDESPARERFAGFVAGAIG
jgi:aminoglycoside phosphotransferase (APT) family kinase protein